MHPALSVIAFTVLSGAGFGLVTLVALFDRLASAVIMLPTPVVLIAGGLGVVLATLGLLASTLHLANPKNAWRAFSRFRSSWLSREAVFAVAFYPFVIGWLGATAFPGLLPEALVSLCALMTVGLALATVFSTGMIYASLRTIRQWNSPLVPLNYLLLGFASGALVLAAIAELAGGPVSDTRFLALLLLVIAAVSKGIYYFWIGAPRGSTINTAVGQTRAQVKLLESGQSGPSFLDKEFRYQASGGQLMRMRWLVGLAGFGVPLALLAVGINGAALPISLLAVASMLAGLFAERWLFFAEARHVVNLFYGAQRT